MKHSLYYDGRQIKNYIIGFASLFAEIPYTDRKGKIKSVPIYYGSYSDVISHLDLNVDTEETKNVNRLKDLTIPLFSFRMTGIERNPDKRRAPHNTKTVDLRPIGYNTGYTTMYPAPYKFTMELTCWASSDYQAFEITEQIIPYFNSPQQVIIQPLPGSNVSTTEVYLDSIDIDTDTESQTYSAVITMTFSLTGYLLTQPKLWSTNLQFELSMLDEKHKKIFKDDDYSIGHKIVDLNTTKPKLPNSETLIGSLSTFIKSSPLLVEKYGEKMDLFKLLGKNGRVDANGGILDTSELTVDYKGKSQLINLESMHYIISEINELKYLYDNDKFKELLSKHTLKDNITLLYSCCNDFSNTIEIYLKLLDKNIALTSFSLSDIPILNSDKLSIFGTVRVDPDETVSRLRSYLGSLEFLQLNKDELFNRFGKFCNKSSFSYSNDIPIEVLSDEIRNAISLYQSAGENLESIELSTQFFGKKLKVITEKNITGKMIIETKNGLEISDFSTDFSGEIEIMQDKFEIGKPFGFILICSNKKIDFRGILVIDETVTIDYKSFDFSIFGLEKSYIVGLNKKNEIVDYEYDRNIFNIFCCDGIFNGKFLDLNVYIVCTLVFLSIQNKAKNSNFLLSILQNKFKLTNDEVVKKANKLINLISKITHYVDISSDVPLVGKEDLLTGQQTFSPDLAQVIAFDNNGKPIYDVNNDGFINRDDLIQLGSVVDNPDDYDYELVKGIWHKRFDVSKLTLEQISNFKKSIKTIFYMIEKGTAGEIYDFVLLLSKDLVDTNYELYSSTEFSYKNDEIKLLGYDLQILDDRLMYLRLFSESLNTVLVKEVKYLKFLLGENLSIPSDLFLNREKIEFNKIVFGVFIEVYLNSFKSMAIRGDKEFEIREILEEPLGLYFDYTYDFKLLVKDIMKTSLIIDSLLEETEWLELQLPNVKAKIKKKYG